jgi:O-acetylserine/cysteine efflux transporter
MKPIHLLFMLMINIIWGLNVPLLKLTLEHVPPITANLVRFLLVALLCAPMLRIVKDRMGILLLTAFVSGCLQFALGTMSIMFAKNVGALSVIGQLGVPFSLILAVAFLGERIRWKRMTGIALSFLGVIVLTFDPAILQERLAIFFTVMAALCYAVSSIMMRNLKGITPLTIQAWVGLISLPFLLPASLLFEPNALWNLPHEPPEVLGYIAYTAIGSSIIAHTGMYFLLQRYPVSVTSPFTLLTPLLVILFSMVILGDRLTIQMWIGAAIVLAGISIITLRSAQAHQSGQTK